jgi:erythromycin esterase
MRNEHVPTALAEYTTAVERLDGLGSGTVVSERRIDALADTLADVLGTERDTEEPVVVGLGETTHGTRECFRLKAGLVALLVREFGVRTLALEAGVAATRSLDAYVRRGVGTPEGSLGTLGQWLWQTETVCELLSWLRSFNRNRPPAEQVRLRGIDLTRIAAPARLLRSYVKQVEPAVADGDSLTRLTEFETPEDQTARLRALDDADTAVDSIEERLLDNEQVYVETTDEHQFTHARHLCDVLHRTCEWHRVRHAQPGPSAAGMEQRDRWMAANASWAVEQDPNGRAAVWAHNSHVKRGRFDDGQVWSDATTMGERLADTFGERYTPLGFDLGGGAFRAVPAGSASGRPERFTLDTPPAESATAVFGDVGGAPWLLDIGAATDDARLEVWFDRPQQIRWVGTVYDPEAPERQYLRTELTDFDGLLFVDQSTASRPVDPAVGGPTER